MAFRSPRMLALISATSAMGLALLCALGWNMFGHPRNSGNGLSDDLRALYPDQPPPAVERGLKVYHLGHSLVGRDMPAMLQQLAGEGHDYASQLGWGTSIKQHLAGPQEIYGFEAENAHPRFMALEDALRDPSFDVLVMTESVDLRDAITYQDSTKAVTRLVTKALAANPDLSIVLYETWHSLDHEDWLERIPKDRDQMWEPALLAPAIRAAGAPVRMVPAGSVMARLVRILEAEGAGAFSRKDLFSDDIHLNDLGNYLVALTHYATLYGRSPEGLPHQLRRADGTAADAPSAELAAQMQRVVWEVVTSSPLHR